MGVRLILMYNESHQADMWYAERLSEAEGRPDYYGPFFEKAIAQKFIDNHLSE